MERLYYYSDGKEKFGPLPVSELSQVGIKPNTLVWSEGMKEWQYAYQRADLLPILKKPKTTPEIRQTEFPQLDNTNNKKAKLLFIIMLIFGFSLMAAIYGVMFNSLSETELLNISLLWIIPFLFGIVGLMAIGLKSNHPVKISLIVTGALVGVLFLLFNALWSLL